MADHTIVNLKDGVEDLAPKFGMSPGLQSRFARGALELEKSGVTYFKVAPDFKTPFGHRHREQEEVYVVVSGSVRVKFEHEIVELGEWDAIRIPGPVARSVQGGPEGGELIAYGAPRGAESDAEMIPDFWEDAGA